MSFSDVFETGLDLGSLWDSVSQLIRPLVGANPGVNDLWLMEYWLWSV